jgi:hypothetical protein
MIETLIASTRDSIEPETLSDVLREEQLIRCRLALKNLDRLEGALHDLGRHLAVLCRNPSARLSEVKPLQEKARMVTSVIRAQIYVGDMRGEVEETAWAALKEKTGLEMAAPLGPPPAEDKEKNKSGNKTASLARTKKNLRTRRNASPSPKNKSTITPETLATIKKDIATGQHLAKTAKKNLLNGTAAPPG